MPAGGRPRWPPSSTRHRGVLAKFETSLGPAAIAHEVQPIEEVPADQGDETQMVKFEAQALLNAKALESRHDDIAVEQRHFVGARSRMAAETATPTALRLLFPLPPCRSRT